MSGEGRTVGEQRATSDDAALRGFIGAVHESFSLGRVFGLRIGANWSLLVIVWLVAWSLAATQLPSVAPGDSKLAYWLVGGAAAVLFFVCLLAHELSHSVVARRRGVEVDGIVLWLFGGVSKLHDDAPDGGTELRIAVAGPLMSVALAAVFIGLSQLLELLDVRPVITAGVEWLGWINGLLAAFNLLPAFPLDGGRVLRAWLWRRRGDKVSATVSAARAGRFFAFLLIWLGVLQFAAGSILGGVWLAFLGWFLLSASTAEASQSVIGGRLAGVVVGDVMTPRPVVAPSDITVQQLIDGWLYKNRCSTFPIVDRMGAVVGLMTMARVKRVPESARPTTMVRDVACPRDAIVVCSPTDPLVDLIGSMNASVDQRALVFDDGELVGIVSPGDVTRALEHAELTAR